MALILLLATALLVSAARRDSLTFDEPITIGAGIGQQETGDLTFASGGRGR